MKIIENSDYERKNFHDNHWGSEDIILTQEEFEALCLGKCLIWDDGEYSHSIRIKE